MNKKDKLNALFDSLSTCNRCINIINKNGKDCSLVNIFEDGIFYKNIPSIWTDWYNRLDSKIMVIGQDWGPYSDMKKLNKEYMKAEKYSNWANIIEKEKSLTKKMLTKYIMLSAKNNNIELGENYIDKIYITNGILCARKGDNYRGDNINLKKSAINCTEFLKEQINIVKPKIILPLGYYPLFELSNGYKFKIGRTLKDNIDKEIKIEDFVIIPLYHPAAQISEEKQLKQYNKIWKYYK